MSTTTRVEAGWSEPRASLAPFLLYPVLVALAFGASWVIGLDHSIGGLLGVAGAVLVVIPLFVALHEMGHVLAGWLAGFRLVWYRATIVKVWRSGAGFRLGGSRRALHGGEVGMVPADLDDLRRADDLRGLRRRLILLFAGGPAATLLMAGAAAALVGSGGWERMVAAAPPELAGYVRMLVYAAFGAVFASAVMGVARLVFPTRGHSDERQLRELVGGGARGEYQARQLLAGFLLFTGERPRAWFPGWLRQGIADSAGLGGEPLDDAALLFFAYYSALDAGEAAEAAALLRRYRAVLERAPSSPDVKEVQLGGLIEDAFLRAFRGGEPGAARSLLEEARGRAEECRPDAAREAALLRAEAAVCLAEGDADAAGEKARAALAGLGATPELPALEEWLEWTVHRSLRASRVAEREWLEEIRCSATRRPASRPLPQTA